MFSRIKPARGSIKVNRSYKGETIEEKIERIVNNKEPIKTNDGAPLIYTERKDGVIPAYDIRTDRFEVAADAMGAVAKTHTAKREARIVEMNKKDEVKDQPTQGTGQQTDPNK